MEINYNMNKFGLDCQDIGKRLVATLICRKLLPAFS